MLSEPWENNVPVLTINPHEATITAQEPEDDFLDWIRAELRCPQIESVMLGPGVCLFLDQMGIFKKDQAFWQFSGAARSWYRVFSPFTSRTTA